MNPARRPPPAAIGGRWRRALEVRQGPLVGLLLGGAVLRAALLFPAARFPADADCIQTGICALHILAGDFRVFYNGVRLGALESYFHALAFLIAEPSRTAMAIAPWLASVATMVVGWAFVRRLAGPRVAAWSLLFLALPSPAFLFWTLQPNGYAEILLLALATLWLAVRVADEPERRGLWLALGLASGLATWASLQTLCCTLPAAAWLVFQRAPLRRGAGKLVAFGALGFAVGAAPWIGYNIRYPLGSFHSSNSVSRPALDREIAADNLRFFASYSLPEVFVSIAPDGGAAAPSRATKWLMPAAAAIYLLGFAWLFLGRNPTIRSAGPGSEDRAAQRAGLLALLVIAATVAINVLSAAGTTRGLTARYALTLYLFAPLAVGGLLVRIARRSRGIAAAVAAVLIAFHLGVYAWPWSPVQRSLTAAAAGEAQLLARLRAEGIDVAIGDYWTVYPLNFVSQETIRGVPCPLWTDLWGYGEGLRRIPDRWALIGTSPESVERQARSLGVAGPVTFYPPSHAVLIPSGAPPARTPQEFLERACAE